MIKYLTTIGRFFTPLAMVVFVAYEISTSMKVNHPIWQIFIVIGAIFTGIGFEAVGILSGHALEGFWKANDKKRTAVSFVLLATYTGSTVYLLHNNSTIWPVPIVAAVLYVVAALSESIEEGRDKEREDERFELGEKAKDRELDRQLKLQRQEDSTTVKLAKIETQSKAKVRTDDRTDVDTSKTDWRTLTHDEKVRVLDFTPEEIVNRFKVSSKTADRWLERAEKLSQKVSSNGAGIRPPSV